MITELIERDFRAGVQNFENENLELSKPFVIIVSNVPILFPPTNRLITLFNSDQRYQANFGLDAAYTLQMPVLNFSYTAFMENLLNSPIVLGKIRFETLARYNGFVTPATLSNFGAFQTYNNTNIGDSDTKGIDLTIALDQQYLSAVDYYVNIKLDGLNQLQFNFPLIAGAIKITCWTLKESSLSNTLEKKILETPYAIPSTMLPIITQVELPKKAA